jgi:hypothetical protein
VAFVLKQSSSYVWPVTVRLPISGGKFEKQTFDAEFKRLPQARINKIQIEVQARIKSSERNETADDSISDQSIADEILIGWANVLDVDGDEVPFSESMKQQLLDIPTMATAIIVAYFDSLTGTKTKNF